MTTIRYFLPEDGDEEAYPNVFLAPKPRQPGAPPTLGQVRNAFPLPGTYHFRFKSPLYPGGDRDKGAMAVWMDVTKENAVVPTWKNTIVAKVSRTGVEDDDDDDDDADFGRHEPVQVRAPAPAPVAPQPTPARAPVSHQNSMHSNASSDHLDIFESSAGSAPPSTGAPNLLDGHGHGHGHIQGHHAPAPAPYPSSSVASGGSTLLDMDSGYGQPQAQAPAAHNDFLGMTAPAQQMHPPQAQQNGYRQGVAPAPNSYGAPVGQGAARPPPQQQQGNNAFNSFSNQQGPFGGLGTPWK